MKTALMILLLALLLAGCAHRDVNPVTNATPGRVVATQTPASTGLPKPVPGVDFVTPVPRP